MVDQELKDWQAAWQAPAESTRPTPPFDIRRHAARATRRLYLRYASGCLFGLVFLVFSASYALQHPTLHWLLWAAVVWIATLVAVGYSIWNGRGLWSAAGESNSAYLELSRKRCLAELRMIRFGYALLWTELAVVTPWLLWNFFAKRGLPGFDPAAHFTGFASLLALTVGYLIWFAVYRRRKLRELTLLADFERSVRDDDIA
ncbi:MAG: hypothetical protein HYX25_03140 [Candidatus Solibacter usitatus]|nr:hypothetical protein [Candidatus Solibacter usitatus]